MQKNGTVTRERERTSDQNLIRKLDATILMIKNTRSDLSKSVIELSGMLREQTQSKQEKPSVGMEKMSTMLDRYLKGGAMLDEIQESFQRVRTDLANNL